MRVASGLILSFAAAASAQNSWFHERDHPVHELFRRDASAGAPAVGSPQWTAQYPDPAKFPPKSLPQKWTDTLNAAVKNGLIPDVPIPSMGAAGSPVYPNKEDPTDQKICSATYQCRGNGDIWDAPKGTVALSFDDGPLPPSPTLYKFLKDNNQHASHFFIGSNILYNWKPFLQAFQDNQDDICVHTYTHPYMTIQTNLGVLAELGYTMQIIHDSTGGRVPKYWRPPFGDVDNRVRAIAKHVFGLTTVIWNQNSDDWQLTNKAIPLATVEASLKSFYTGPKYPGLVILEHELSDASVQAFISSYPLIKQNGWNATIIPEIDLIGGSNWYQNAVGNNSTVSAMDVGAGDFGSSSSSSASASASASSSSGSGSSTASGSSSASSASSASSTTSPSGSSSSPTRTGTSLSSTPSPTQTPSSSKLNASLNGWLTIGLGTLFMVSQVRVW